MIIKMIDEINKALDLGLYLCALSLALTLPDICGKAEYPNANVTTRYIEWFNEYIGKYEKCPQRNDEDEILPYASGEVIYQLRCSLFHQGSTDINIKKINAPENKVTNFSLIVNQDKDDIFGGSSSLTLFDKDIIERDLEISIQDLCRKICKLSEYYYDKNKEKFDFMKVQFVDWKTRVLL